MRAIDVVAISCFVRVLWVGLDRHSKAEKKIMHALLLSLLYSSKIFQEEYAFLF